MATAGISPEHRNFRGKTLERQSNLKYACRAMKRLPPLLLLLFALASFGASQSGRRTVTNIPAAPVQPPANPEPVAAPVRPEPAALTFLPDRLRERYIRSLDDNSFRLADFEGKVLVINLWASWCGPCRREIPDYEKVRREYLGRNVEFIGLTTEDPAGASSKVNKFVRDTGFGFILGWADRETARLLMSGRRGIPQTLVVDGNGNVVSHWVGYSPRESAGRLRDAIENALK